MKYLKLYESYSQVEQICKKYNIKNWTLNDDGSIDVEGDVDLRGRNYSKFWKGEKSNSWLLSELPIKFRNVNGEFDCRYNELTTLFGAPKRCHNFFISNNNLTSLEGSPKEVNRFLCCGNPLKSLEGGPIICRGDCSVDECGLNSLKGRPNIINGYFGFSDNNIHTIDDLPEMKEDQIIFMRDTPIYNLCRLFLSDKGAQENVYGGIHNGARYSSLDLFFKSLHYGYLKGNLIIEHKLQIACDDYGITMPEQIEGYTFI